MNSSTAANNNNENDHSPHTDKKIGSSKKRKLSIDETSSSTIEIEVLQFANEKLKEYVKRLEAEKNEEKTLEMKDTISKLQSINAKLCAKNEQENLQHKTEMDSIKNEYTAKIQILEDEKQKFEANIKELTDEISTMKIIKSEIKDSVENERETVEDATNKLNAELNELKQKNSKLEKEAREMKVQLLNTENKNKEMKTKFVEAEFANQKLEQKCKELEATISKNKKDFHLTIEKLKEINQFFTITNTALQNNEKSLKNLIDFPKKSIEILEKNESEMKVFSLNEVFNGSKFDYSLLSCKRNIIINITKLEGTSSDGWKLYSTTNETEKPRLLTQNDMFNTCFKMNITGKIHIRYGPKFSNIIHKINICELTEIHISWQDINYADYQKLVSSKNLQICFFEYFTVNFDNNRECSLDELLKHLPNIKEFTYKYYKNKKDHSMIAKNLGQLDPFLNLQKFEISNIFDSFKLEDLHTFIKKNDKNVSYIFSFCDVTHLSVKKEIQKAGRNLLKSLSFPCKISIKLI